jgi:hypothetical protein
MELPGLGAVERCDALYLSTRDGDALLSCAARFQSDRARGHDTLLLSVFDGSAFRAAAAAPVLGASVRSLAWPRAARRQARYASFTSACFGAAPDEGPLRERLAAVLDDVRVQARPRDVYAPLGVGGHVDHRVLAEAAIAAFGAESGRNVFLYEDRPECLSRGEVRLRLGLMGARLPAGAASAAEAAAIPGRLLRQHRGAALRGEGGGLVDRWRALGPGLARWRQARAWNPQRAFGPRLQPVLHVADEAGARFAAEVQVRLLGRAAPWAARQASAYSARLGRAEGHLERYWLLLPRLGSGPAADHEERGD